MVIVYSIVIVLLLVYAYRVDVQNKERYDNIMHSRVAYWDTIVDTCGVMDLNPNLLATIQIRETGFLPKHLRASAVSPVGAIGLNQVMPYHARRGENLYNPATNIRVSARILKELVAIYGSDMDKIFAVYNGGHGQARLANKDRCRETRNYVVLAMNTYNYFNKISVQ
jgi:soluble lytic murein transglycosylase-like protein